MAFDIRETAFKLPENWKLVRLGDIAKVNEKSLTKKSQPDFIRYIDISSVSTGAFDTPKLLKKDEIPSRAKRILRNNDFIISTVRPNLKQFSFIEKAQENLIASTGFCVISSNNSKLAWYLYSLITSDLFTEYLVKIADGGAYPAFNPKEIEDAIIPLPDKDNLEFISDTSRFFHKKIQLNTQINQTLEQIAQALFKSWFVDFDPVRAKVQALSDGLSLEQAELAAMQAISGKTPEELTALSQTQPERYAELAETAKAFPCEMVEVDGVEVPKGWKQTTLSEICEMQNGYAFKSSEWTDTGIPVIKIGSIQSKILTVEGNGFVSEDNLSLRSNFVLNGGDIVIGLTGAYVGKVGRMPANKKAMLNQRVAKFLAKQMNESETFYSFIYMNMIQEDFKNFVDFTAQGSAQPNISTRDILKYPLLLANTEVHLVFEKLLKKTLDKSIFNSYQNEILSNSRDLLLPRLLNGKL